MLNTLEEKPAAAARPREEALADLLRGLLAQGYRFITPTPLTHQRVLARDPNALAADLRGVFGWSRTFTARTLPPALLSALDEGGMLLSRDGAMQSKVRVSALGDDLFLHSAYPTLDDDSVFFGPDTYRFARFIEQSIEAFARTETQNAEPVRVLDIGCGSGAGGIAAARRLAQHGRPSHVTLNDINPCALHLASVNAAVARVPFTLVQGDALQAIEGEFDLIVSNPPYMADPRHRAYRDGGGGLGRELSVRIAERSLKRLAPGGRLLLYTGVAIVDGADPFVSEVEPLLRAAGCEWTYEEIDPDVFGEELEAAPYDRADRIAAVGLVATRKRGR